MIKLIETDCCFYINSDKNMPWPRLFGSKQLAVMRHFYGGLTISNPNLSKEDWIRSLLLQQFWILINISFPMWGEQLSANDTWNLEHTYKVLWYLTVKIWFLCISLNPEFSRHALTNPKHPSPTLVAMCGSNIHAW